MAEKLRVGVIGAGRWSGSAHLPGFTRSPLSDVVMICDLHRDLAEAKAQQFGIPEVVTDYEKILQRSDIDVVVTEHGIADLRDIDDAERRDRLIAIAAPEHRTWLASAEN